MSKLLRYSGPFTDKTEVFDRLEVLERTVNSQANQIASQRRSLDILNEEIDFLISELKANSSEKLLHDISKEISIKFEEVKYVKVEEQEFRIFQRIPKKFYHIYGKKPNLIFLDNTKKLADQLSEMTIKAITKQMNEAGLI